MFWKNPAATLSPQVILQKLWWMCTDLTFPCCSLVITSSLPPLPLLLHLPLPVPPGGLPTSQEFHWKLQLWKLSTALANTNKIQTTSSCASHIKPFRPTTPLAFLASSSQLCHFQVQILHRNPALHLPPWLQLVVATVHLSCFSAFFGSTKGKTKTLKQNSTTYKYFLYMYSIYPDEDKVLHMYHILT